MQKQFDQRQQCVGIQRKCQNNISLITLSGHKYYFTDPRKENACPGYVPRSTAASVLDQMKYIATGEKRETHQYHPPDRIELRMRKQAPEKREIFAQRIIGAPQATCGEKHYAQRDQEAAPPQSQEQFANTQCKKQSGKELKMIVATIEKESQHTVYQIAFDVCVPPLEKNDQKVHHTP